jgi:mitochondrial fission protein ELM1
MTQGEAGMVSQALGLAEALGFNRPEIKKIALRWPWTWAPNWPVLASTAALREPLSGPWPDVLITCGRKAAFASLAIGRQSPATKRIHIQNPHAGVAAYDLVIVPEHDGLNGPNVLVSRAALHRVTGAKLREGRAAFEPILAHLPRPLVAVLLGGSNRNYRLTPEWAAAFAQKLVAMHQASGCGFAITPSRRTDPAALAAFKTALGDLPGAVVWDGAGANPFFGYLGSADAVIVTCESISMISEACATGAAVLLARLPGKSARFEKFFAKLERMGLVRWFSGKLELWENSRLDDMDRIASQVRQRINNFP